MTLLNYLANYVYNCKKNIVNHIAILFEITISNNILGISIYKLNINNN